MGSATAAAKADEAPAEAAAPASPTKPEESAAADAPKTDLKGRNVTYKVTPRGLVIEVDGVKLEPKAVAVQKAGGWVVKITVQATDTDGHMHRLLSPEGGPLMIAAVIDHGGGKQERIGDERKGDGEEFVAAGDSTKLERTFGHPIRAGESVQLAVGLWGLGHDADERRPVRKLFKLDMKGDGKPVPVITPPEGP